MGLNRTQMVLLLFHFFFRECERQSGKIETKNFIRVPEKLQSDHVYPPAAVYFYSLLVSFFIPDSILVYNFFSLRMH